MFRLVIVHCTFSSVWVAEWPPLGYKLPARLAICSHCLLAHLSKRLIGELIGYPWSGVRRPLSVVVRPSTISNVFCSETASPIKAKLYVEPPWEGGTKVYRNGPGHLTKIAAMPIYGKKFKKSSSPEPEVL